MATVRNYIGHFEDVFLFFGLGLFDYSLKRQMYNPSKMYCIDHALASSMAFKFSENRGRTVENIVYTELRRGGDEIYYWKDKKGREVDFLTKQGRSVTKILQVSTDISREDTKSREITGALAAAKEFGLNEATIITTEAFGDETTAGITIHYIPTWQWLTEKKYLKADTPNRNRGT